MERRSQPGDGIGIVISRLIGRRVDGGGGRRTFALRHGSGVSLKLLIAAAAGQQLYIKL